jgi:hypothetical protein
MKQYVWIVNYLLVACTCTWSIPALAQVGNVKHIPVRNADTYEGLSINVLDFGARGDGKTDDTEAIRAAVKAAYERRTIPQHPQYGYFVSFAEVYFPSGHYLINDTIDISYVKLRGENYAAIEQLDPEKDLFYAHDAWRQIIEELTFLGGKVQLNLGNPNVDSGHVIVRDCHFKNSRGPAVQLRTGTNSTQFIVERCVFIRCEQALVTNCDLCVLRDCWITSQQTMKNKAVIENYLTLHVDNLLAVPQAQRGEGYTEEWTDLQGTKHTTTNQRWIDNYHTVHIRNTRFGGEHGGFSAVWNFAPFGSEEPVQPTSVTIEDSYVYANHSAAVVLKDLPNVLCMSNCNGLNNAWLVRVDPKLNLDTYFDEANRRSTRRMTINFTGNHGENGTGLPQQLWPYQINDVLATAPPTAGQWTQGRFIKNARLTGLWTTGYQAPPAPAANEPYGWVCVEAGTPGTWIPVRFLP